MNNDIRAAAQELVEALDGLSPTDFGGYSMDRDGRVNLDAAIKQVETALATPTSGASDLHAAIMGLQPVIPGDVKAGIESVIYTHGFNDCRDAAAELVAASASGAKRLRYTNDGALAECPCCGSLDVGGAHET